MTKPHIYFILIVLCNILMLDKVEAKAKVVLWESGLNQYVKIVKRERHASPNQHPVSLSQENVVSALGELKLWLEEEYEESVPNNLFSLVQQRILAEFIVIGLQQATPKQDLIFSLSGKSKLFLGLTDKVFIGGRIFYQDDQLNIIIGDYNKPQDKGMEAISGGFGIAEIKYDINTGSRKKASRNFKQTIIKVEGLDINKSNNDRRLDWLLLDIDKIVAYALVTKREAKKQEVARDPRLKQIQLETDKLAKERRDFRLEMARIREEIQQETKSISSDLSTEDRLRALDNLLAKKLISQNEYEQKRQEILDDI